MHEFDVLVIGGGAANKVASAASGAGLETALVEPGPLGGTCLNRGCNPSKMLIGHANAVNAVHDAERFHVDASVDGVDFAGLVDEVHDQLGAIAEGMAADKREDPNLALFEQYAEFVGDRTVALEDGTELAGDKVVVGAGSRPVVPPIDGLDEVDYLTSAEAIRLREPPEELVVLGGGYVAVELGYYFDAFGTDVTLIDMLDTLVPREDPEIAEAFTDIARERHTVHVGYRVNEASQDGDRISVTAEAEDGGTVEASGDALLVAAGRRPNTDTLAVEAGGIETDDRGFVVTDDRLRTSADGVWAQGDIADNAMFKHSVDHEAEVMAANVVRGEGREIDLRAMPHAIFTEPQIAGVGATEAELEESGRDYAVGRASFPGSIMGRAKKFEHGFAKALADPETGEILGFHVLGHEASTLVHEVVPVMRLGGTVDDIADAIFAHPSLSKITRSAFQDAAT
ncbi:MAG: dihydrolipoyl dehydrogenase [Halobacteriales archaeon]|nr:dihydrolipoyl dehydrogenase [Halobacteriales archaeon]